MRLLEGFDRPLWLAALGLVPVVGLGLGWADDRRRRALERWVGPRLHELMDLRPRARARGRLLALLVLTATLLALAGPRLALGGDIRSAAPSDYVLCLDVSRSMLARDEAPTRLDAARRGLRALLARLTGERVALVLYAGEARLRVPLTSDYASCAAIAEEAGTESVARGGSDLASALALARSTLAQAGSGAGVVVLLGDGEQAARAALDEAEACRASGILVHALGLGSPRGSKIALAGEQGESYLRDRAGAEVISSLNTSGLRALAAATGGGFLTTGSGTDAWTELVQQSRGRGGARAASGEPAARAGFQLPLLAAFLLWLWSLAREDRSRT